MTLAKERPTQDRSDQREILAMAFRDDGAAEKITIHDLSFDGCRLESEASFAIGERLRLHIRGQGWIEAEVQRTEQCLFEVIFTTICRV
jgi:hypothetical protein